MLYGVLVVAFAALGLLAWGMRLPATRHADRDVLINAPREAVWSVLADLLRQVEWRSDLKSVEMGESNADAPTWVERPRRGPARVMRVTRRKEGRLLEIERLPDGFCFGNRSLTLETAARATRVSVVETLHIPNPLARIYGRLWLEREAVLELLLRDLKQRVEAGRASAGEG